MEQVLLCKKSCKTSRNKQVIGERGAWDQKTKNRKTKKVSRLLYHASYEWRMRNYITAHRHFGIIPGLTTIKDNLKMLKIVTNIIHGKGEPWQEAIGLLPHTLSTTDASHQMDDYVSIDEVLRCTSLLAASSIIRTRRLVLFGHVARLADDVPANQILRTCCTAQDGARPSPDWRRVRGRPLTTWIHQICRDTGIPVTDRRSGAGRRQIVLATHRNGGMLRLNALRHDDDDDDDDDAVAYIDIQGE